MPVSSADIATPEASRLIKRLCTHWGHKFAVAFDDASGNITFDAGTRTRLHATPERLHARVEAADAATLERFEAVVENHLQRMARAGALVVAWQRADT